jgi:hypothetical protein
MFDTTNTTANVTDTAAFPRTPEAHQRANEEGSENGFQLEAASNWDVREHLGFFQSREKGSRTWQFHVSSFDGTHTGECGWVWLLLANKELEQVRVDEKDRLCIQGKRYGRSQWNH